MAQTVMNWNDEEQMSVHAVAEYAYCPRSAFGLLNDSEGAVAGTGSFREGAVLHEIVDEGGEKLHRGWLVERSIRVSSDSLKLTGIIDQARTSPEGIETEIWEYKRGKKRESHIHELQVALLAHCWKETRGMIPQIGVVWTIGDRRSRHFHLTAQLMEEAEALAREVSVKRVMPPSAWPRRRQDGCIGCIYRYQCWGDDLNINV